MVEKKLPPKICNILEKSYEIFYHSLFLKVCKSYETTPIGLNMKKTACVGKPSKNFLLLWEKELAAEYKFAELAIIVFVQKLFDFETEFISKFSLYTVQEDWLSKIRNILEK